MTKSPYSLEKIADELDATANGHSYHGNALRVAKDIPFLTAEHRSCLDRFADGSYGGSDRFLLQDMAIMIRIEARRGKSAKMPASTHLPLPLALYFDHPDESVRNEIGYIAPAAADGKRGGIEVATVFSCANDPRQKEYAELLVRAANAHADLVKVAELVLASFSYAPGAGPDYYEAARLIVQELKAPTC